MAQQRQKQGGFRFSLPWVGSSSQAAPKKTLPQAPIVEAQSAPASRRSATSQNSNQQQTTPRAQQSKDIDSQKASPSKASTQQPSLSRQNSQPRRITKSPSQNSSQTRSSPTHQSPLQIPIKSPPITQIPSPPRVNAQIRLAPQTPSPPRTLPYTKQKSQKIPKLEISRTLAPKSNEPSHQPSTSQIPYENQRNEDKEKQYLDENSEQTIKGKELAHEPKIVTQISDTRVTNLSGLIKEPILSDEILESEEEKVVSIEATLNPTSSTKEQTKTIISDLANKDQDQISHHKGINDEISKFGRKMTNEHQKLPLDENQISVITLTGENRGATMSLGYESEQRDGKINIRRDYKVIPHESSDSEKSSSGKSSDEEPTAYINSNIQSINNSIMFNSSITNKNPGVHFEMSRTVMEMERVDESKGGEKIEDCNKTKFNVAQSQKLSYKPVVRRRCLKGLFMESSDSDPSNPDKPRRHGCRYVCSEKNGEDLL